MMNASEPPEAEIASSPSAVAVEENSQPVVHSDPEIMGRTPVFYGTRVPVDAMFDYLAGNYCLDKFLDGFPTVSPAQALDALEIGREAVLRASARPD
ncbi:MAG TPA: DUF433 domain-containing protein [Thermomicrobiales bacterium]|nr:DUF433 domain-containing protein [Thermomicrobiales bacterium]